MKTRCNLVPWKCFPGIVEAWPGHPERGPVQTYSGGRKYLEGSAPDGDSVTARFQIPSGNP